MEGKVLGRPVIRINCAVTTPLIFQSPSASRTDMKHALITRQEGLLSGSPRTKCDESHEIERRSPSFNAQRIDQFYQNQHGSLSQPCR